MKLLLVSDDGQIIDSSDDFTRAEFDAAMDRPFGGGAFSLLDGLNADAR